MFMSAEGSLYCSGYSRWFHGFLLAQIILQRRDMQSDLTNCWFSVGKEWESIRSLPIWYQPCVPCGAWYAAYCVLVWKVAEGGK